MHVFEVTIQKDRQVDRCEFAWPEWWGEVYQDVDVVAYEDHPDLHGNEAHDPQFLTSVDITDLASAEGAAHSRLYLTSH